MHSALTKTAAFFGPKIFAVSLSVLGSCLEDSEKLLKKAWKIHRGNNKSADEVFVFENNASKHGKIDKWRIGLHVIWQTTKNGQHLKGLAF